MKHALPALLLIATVPTAQAQLVNGSFEENGQPSLNGWTPACEEALLLPGGAPGAGQWHAGYSVTPNGLGCGVIDALYQELPWLTPNDQILTIGFWAKMPSDPSMEHFLVVDCRLGWINNSDVFQPEIYSGEYVFSNTEWTYNTVTFTANPGPQPLAITALGFVGYDTTSTGIMELDGIEILSIEEQGIGIATVDPAKVLGYYDAAQEAIVISKPFDSPLLCFDAAGRSIVDLLLTGSRNGAQTFATASLAPGTYTAVSGKRSLRFFKQ